MAEIDYTYFGTYDAPTFERLSADRLRRNPRYNSGAIPAMLKLVDLIGRDPKVRDVRWGAYMLATVMWETTSPVKVDVPARSKKGKPLLDKKGQPIILKRKRWMMTMAPVDEVGHGAGRAYHEPVKVSALPDGTARITEQDGDQFSVSADGVVKKLTKGAKMGTKSGAVAVKAYDDDTGSEHAYFGRGYVQLTWWSNYATSGVAIGRGLDLLRDPELVKEPEVAYAIMSHGMVTGSGFANGHKFSNYFSGQSRDYVHARRMVNGTDHAADIASLAEQFEAILLDSRVSRPNGPLPPPAR